MCHSTPIFSTDCGSRLWRWASRSWRHCCRRGRRHASCQWRSCGLNETGGKVLRQGPEGYGSRFAPTRDYTWEAGPAAVPELSSGRKAYRKVLKHRQLEMFQFRTVSRSTGRSSLGEKMGNLLGKDAQTIGSPLRCSRAHLMHLIYMPAGLWGEASPCRRARAYGVSL